MNEFSFFKELLHPTTPTNKKIETNSIAYRNYVISADSEYSVNIPLRECDNFENDIGQIDFDLFTRNDLKNLVRKYRGIID